MCFSLCEPADGLLQTLLELNQRPPIQPLHRAADIGTTALRIVNHRRDMADAGVGANGLGHQADDFVEAELDRIAQVDRPGLR
jgi:hypothetical protein